MDRRLQARYVKLVESQAKASARTAAGPALRPGRASAEAATQAAWRFYNNERIGLSALVEPLRAAGREACAQSASEFVLLAHDWSKLDYGTHASKRDRRQLTHQHDVGYDLTTSLLIDAANGQPLAPMELHLKTATTVHSTSRCPPQAADHHLDQLLPVMESVGSWELPRRVVHVIDREADALGRFRSWDAAGHLFLVRCDDRRVLWNEGDCLISEIVAEHDRQGGFQEVRQFQDQGQTVQQGVAEAQVTLHRPHKARVDGTPRKVAGAALKLRLIMTRVVDAAGNRLAEWTLLTNALVSADASQIALWYYWRWRIESFYKLLKSHGQEIEYWQQETGVAIARRLLVAAMACVAVWTLQRDDTPQAEETKQLLLRLSGRARKRNAAATASALLAGYFVLLSLTDLLENTDLDLPKLQTLAARANPFPNTS